jgi:hypothetical protein
MQNGLREIVSRFLRPKMRGETIMAKTTTEKIDSIKEEIQRLENQQKKLMQQQKEQERKARTKRLIERGAILESLIPEADTLTNDQIKAFLEKTITNDYAHKMMINVTAQASMAAVSNTEEAAGSVG